MRKEEAKYVSINIVLEERGGGSKEGSGGRRKLSINGREDSGERGEGSVMACGSKHLYIPAQL